MEKNQTFFCALFTFLTVSLSAQNVTVKGVVKDASTGDALPFASVVLKGSHTVGTSSDVNGNYSISVPSGGSLVFSAIGYESVEVAVSGKNVINVAIKPDAQFIEETVVVGYGSSNLNYS